MNPKIIEIVRTAAIPLKLNAKAGASVLIVADTGTDPLVWQAYAAAARTLDMRPTVTIMPPLAWHHAEPTAEVAAAMQATDLNILCTSKALIHSGACHAAMRTGHPFIASEEVSVEMLREGGTTADYPAMHELGKRIQRLWNAGKSVHITSAEGTDLRASIQGRSSWLTTAMIIDQGPLDLLAAGFPDGEVGVSPVEESVEGVVVWDTSMHQIGLLSQPIRATFQQGRAVSIEGGDEARRLREYLERNGDENAYLLGEISIGLNPKARITGYVREDKKLLGCVHIALGMNTDTGGKVASKIHVDGVVRRPTIYIDDALVVEQGTIRA